MAGTGDEAATGLSELAGQRRQRQHGADAAAAVPVALEAVADGDDGPVRVPVEGGKFPDFIGRQAADVGGLLHRVLPRPLHEGLESLHMLGDEVVIEAIRPFELTGDREGQHDIRSRLQGKVNVRLLRRLDALGIDDDDLGAVPDFLALLICGIR